jgi:hypothetical protein
MASRPGDGLVRVCALLGLVVSAYALYVEHEVAAAAAAGLEYKAACDLSATMSCSKVLTSSCRCSRYHALVGAGAAGGVAAAVGARRAPSRSVENDMRLRADSAPGTIDKTCTTVR